MGGAYGGNWHLGPTCRRPRQGCIYARSLALGKSVHSAAPNMDTTTSSLNTPEISTATQQEHTQQFEDEAALHDLASLFDPIHFLDETVEFMEPLATQQEASGVNPPKPDGDDMCGPWSQQVMEQVLSMEQQQQQQQQQPTQQLALPNENVTPPQTKKRRNGSILSRLVNKKKKNAAAGADKENQPPTYSSGPVATTPPSGILRSRSEWPVANLFPSGEAQYLRRPVSEPASNTSTSMEGVEAQTRKRVETKSVGTSTEEEQCSAAGYPTLSNIVFEVKANQNLYRSRAYKEVISKSKMGISYRTYLAAGQIMLNITVDQHTKEVQGAWMNLRGGNENNLPFKLVEIMEFVSVVMHQESSTPQIDHRIGNTIRMVTEDGRLKLIKGTRIITVDISSLQKFEELREGCHKAYEVLQLLENRHQQRRWLEHFLVNTPLPCSCPSGGADHVKHYYYSSLVSDVADVLPIEWVYKVYA